MLAWLLQGMASIGIAATLSMRPRTAQEYLQRIDQSLGVHTRVEMIVLCLLQRIGARASRRETWLRYEGMHHEGTVQVNERMLIEERG